MCSRVLGFLRDIGFAHLFGAAPGLDAFLVAFKIPNFMRRLFAEGAFTQAFVPVLADQQQHASFEMLRRFRAHVFGVLLSAVMLVTMTVWLFAPQIMIGFAPGFSRDSFRFAQAGSMLHMTVFYLPFISIASFAAAVLNTNRIFALPAAMPLVLNICLIAATFIPGSSTAQRIAILPVAIVIAGGLQCLFLLFNLRHIRQLDWPRWGWGDPAVRKVLKILAASLFGVSVTQIGLLLNTVLGSFLRESSISWLYYSDRLVQLPLGVIGVALTTVMLPGLSKAVARGEEEQFNQQMCWGLSHALSIVIPASVGLFLLATPILTSLFQYGAFSAQDVRMTALSLRALSIGLPAFVLVKLLASAFYAHNQVKIPVRTGVVAIIANVMLGYILMQNFAHMGLALSTSIASWIDTILLIVMLWRYGYLKLGVAEFKLVLRVSVASICMAAGLMAYQQEFLSIDLWFQWELMQRVMHLMCAIGGSTLVYACVMLALGWRWR